MTAYDLGDRVTLSTTLRDAAGEPTDATVSLTVWSPANVVTTPVVTDPAGAGTYEAQIEPDETGLWLYRWTSTGLVEAVDGGSFQVRDAQVAAATEYCTVADVRQQLGDTDLRLPEEALRTAVATASREIDEHCGRKFWLDRETSTRLYDGGFAQILIDDVGTLDELEVATAADGSTFTTLVADAYELSPLNPVMDVPHAWWWLSEAPGSDTTWAWARRIRVTARWGWSSVPEQVRLACVLRAVNLFKRKDSPYGVAGFGEFGVMRIRMDPDVNALLQPFVRQIGIA